MSALTKEDLPAYTYEDYQHWEGNWEFVSFPRSEAVKVSAEQYITYIPHPNILDVWFFFGSRSQHLTTLQKYA